MNLDNAYEIDTLRTMSETLDEETIIISLENGNYYNLNSTATVIWNKIEEHYTAAQIIQYISNCYNESVDNIKSNVEEVLKTLEKDELITKSDNIEKIEIEYKDVAKEKYIIPLVEKYEDMQEMLLADPIHDVEEKGWPKVKTVNYK
jgi:hypothetical protein